MNDPGFERLLRNALHTELTLRLRHTLLHGLKGPVQTVLSALHLLQKKAGEGQTQDLEKYANWIKDAAKDLTERAQAMLPPAPLASGETASCDLHAVTDDAAHVLRDEASLKEVELTIEPVTEPAPVRGNDGDLRLALLALLLRIVDAAAPNSVVRLSLKQVAAGVDWSAEVAGANKPDNASFELRYDAAPPQSGIAWHVVRAIIRDHGGNLAVDDHGSGWRVQFTLPRA